MNFRAIVIEDYPLCRDLLCYILGSRGYEVVCFADTGFCQTGNNPTVKCSFDVPCCDFLLTDNRMPGISGLELLELQKNCGCKIPIENKAIISGAWAEHELGRARSFGCQIFYKPLNLEELFSWLNDQERNISPGRILADHAPYCFPFEQSPP